MTTPSPAMRGAGFGCVVLFLIPFAAVGVFSAARAVGSALAGDWAGAAFLGLFGVVFGLVGMGGIIGVVKGRRAGELVDAVRAEHPDSPWMWRPDWAAGRIEDSNRSTMVGAWIFAGLWNLISLPSAFFGVRQAIRGQSPAAWLVLIFPAVGLGLLGWAVRATLRYRRYGVSRLELGTLPASIGQSLRGTVHAPGMLDVREVLVSLTCLRRVTTGAGKNRSTSERVLWQEERRVSARQTRTAAGMMTAVPIDFALAANLEPCDDSNPRDQIVWRLALEAEVPGVDYHSTFEVPVFRTGESGEAPAAGESAVEAPPLPSYVQPATSRIRVTRNQRGTEIEFPAGRNPGASAGLTVFLLLWLGIVWATWHFGAPTLIQVIFGGFGLLLFWGTASLWLGVSRVAVDRDSVTVARGLVTPLREHRLPAAEIADVTTKIGMQAGGTPYYDLILVRTDGKQVSAGRGLRDKREAEWLATTVREVLRG